MPRTSTKSTETPTKKAAKSHNQLSSGDVDCLIQGVLNATPVTPTSSPKKRKTAVVISDDDSSSVEIIESPQPSPKKAKAGTPPPSPGTAAFKNLPPVSVSDMLDDILRPGTSISFGTTGRPARTKVKTEKGAVLEQLKATRKSRSKGGNAVEASVEPLSPSIPASANPSTPLGELTYPDSPLVKKSPAKSAAPKMPKIKAVDEDVVMSSPSPIRDLRKGRKAPPKADTSDDELPHVSELLLFSPKNRAKTSSISAALSQDKTSLTLANVLDLEAISSEDESAQSARDSDRYLATDDDGEVGYHTDPAPVEQGGGNDSSSDRSDKGHAAVGRVDDGTPDKDEVLEDPDAVTSTLYQDPALRKIYENLPFLQKQCPILPYAQAAGAMLDTTSERYVFSKIAATLNASEANTLLKAMLFTQSGVHVSLSRIHPNLLQQDSGRLRMKRPDNAAAVPVYVGICTRGAISDVDLVGPPSSLNGVHGISVAGSDQETRRYMAVLGAVLGYESITGHISKLGISFYTRGQGKNGNFGPPPAARTTTSTHSMSALLSSVALPAPVAHARGYPMSRSFEDRIPVYDGRTGSGRKFNFTDDDFNNLRSWPLYRRGRGEVDQGTLVAVGHTISTWSSASGRFLSTNVQFVIVLGKPAVGL